MAIQVAVRLPDIETRELFKRAMSIEGETIQSFLHRKIMDRVDLQRRRESEGPIDFRELEGILGGDAEAGG